MSSYVDWFGCLYCKELFGQRTLLVEHYKQTHHGKLRAKKKKK